MFTSNGPFKAIECPGGLECGILNCIFGHGLGSEPAPTPDSKGTKRPGDSPQDPISAPSGDAELPTSEVAVQPPPSKKLRRSNSEDGPVVLRQASKEAAASPASSSQSNKNFAREEEPEEAARSARPVLLAARSDQEPATKKRSISPPPLKRDIAPAADPIATPGPHSIIVPLTRKRNRAKKEILVPRQVAKPPSTHATRVKLLALLHGELSRLDKLVRESTDPWKEALSLTPQELITAALDEEEKAARSSAAIYANVLKLRITALKKLTLETWRAERLTQLENEFPELRKPVAPTRVDTGLTGQEEIAMLPNLVTPLTDLEQFGYVPKDIEPTKLEEARKGVAAAHGYETCDRCETRFQVFPGRREDGVLTTGGDCTYHPGRARKPPRERGQAAQPERYTCCQDVLGSNGCTRAKHHVFKAAFPARLALTMPFKRVSAGAGKAAKPAVCFDCEMGYTTHGMELIRLTATEWPNENMLLDVLVRPLGEVLDLNSAYSGVFPEQLASAVPYDVDKAKQSPSEAIGIVDSPATARELFFRFIGPSTVLIGHALENDLNAVRIIHPTVVDTVLLYPHPAGLPVRYGLKHLARTHLLRDIQMGGAQGHDSKEDAIVAGELVRLSVRSRWRQLEDKGWKIESGDFIPPPPKGLKQGIALKSA